MPDHGRVSNHLAALLTIKCGNRHAPDSLSRNAPVGPALEHVAHALTTPGGNPFDSLIDFAQGHHTQGSVVQRFSIGEVAGEVGEIAAILVLFNGFAGAHA